jgi:hypothetical protein
MTGGPTTSGKSIEHGGDKVNVSVATLLRDPYILIFIGNIIYFFVSNLVEQIDNCFCHISLEYVLILVFALFSLRIYSNWFECRSCIRNSITDSYDDRNEFTDLAAGYNYLFFYHFTIFCF